MARSMSLLAALAAGLATATALAAMPALAASNAALTPQQRALLSSRQLWATVDVCSPSDQPYTVGIRGSMPGDGQAHDKMYMSFRLQYMSSSLKRWVDLAGASSNFVAVGTGASARQGGRSFQLVAGNTAATLRGVVRFQWRRGKTVMFSVSRPTSGGHKSLAGADPPGYSAATCQIG
jgi:hypothetical protein